VYVSGLAVMMIVGVIGDIVRGVVSSVVCVAAVMAIVIVLCCCHCF